MLEDIRKVRLEKLDMIRKSGIEAYPSKSWRTHKIVDAIANFDVFAEDKKTIVLAGRILAIREHGGATFVDVNDGSGVIQFLLKKDTLGDKDYGFFNETVDIGDFVEGHGFLFKTKREERTLEINKYRILAKSLLPLPEKWHGLKDVDERFRRRYLDFIFNEDARMKFSVRARVNQGIREFMNRNDFLEVQTPVLQPLYGGASARPFKTNMHALGIDLYLRIAPELYLKRLLVGGFEKVYEFTTNFRNEGMDREHNPEFFAMEYYAAYKDLEWSIQFTSEMLETIVKAVLGKTEVIYEDKKIDFKRPYRVERFADLLKDHVGIEYEFADDDTLKNKANELGIKTEKHATKASVADEIFKKFIRPKLLDPTFVTAWPAEILPLAKRLPAQAGSDEGEYVDAFQFFAGGLELIKAFTELNDPLDQRERFKTQESKRAKGDEEAQRMDEDYVEAMEYGMPPSSGWGLGLDRFIMLLTNSHSIREVILFPTMRPRDSE